MRLIDADALPKYTGYALSANEVAIAVENAPTIDAVQVVRCKECKHWTPEWIDALAEAETGVCAETIKQTEDCDFCSRAERKRGTMSNLIDRQAAIEIADAVWIVTGDTNVANVWDKLKGLPTIDAVQVIRCKECKHWKKDTFQIGDNFVGMCCRKAAIKSEFPCTAEGFCKWAERRKA